RGVGKLAIATAPATVASARKKCVEDIRPLEGGNIAPVVRTPHAAERLPQFTGPGGCCLVKKRCRRAQLAGIKTPTNKSRSTSCVRPLRFWQRGLRSSP